MRVTVSVPEELYTKMEKWKDSLNFSNIFQEAISRKISKKELFHQKLREETTMKDIFENADFTTPVQEHLTGKEMGFIYAKTAPYPEIRRLEKYVEGWRDEGRRYGTLKEFRHDVDIEAILNLNGLRLAPETLARLGLYDDIRTAEPVPANDRPFPGFVLGFMDGVMEFICEEFSGPRGSSDAEARKAIEEIFRHLPDDKFTFKSYSHPRGKVGIRTSSGNRVVLTWKSYKLNALDTRKELVPVLKQYFPGLEPTHNKPHEYFFQGFSHGAELLEIAKEHAKEIAEAINKAVDRLLGT
ncbi:MAG: hypothetical protein SWQ30_02725 [Thermodesulfobacteriota bacterium]|nr:hypothetical protein [Thermodesulfobacteriota bacterium]